MVIGYGGKRWTVFMSTWILLAHYEVITPALGWAEIQMPQGDDISSANRSMYNRRKLMIGAIKGTGLITATLRYPSISKAASDTTFPGLYIMKDRQTYSALGYSPPRATIYAPPPLILVLHGAGKNRLDIRQDLADPNGEHAGLIPSLIATGQAPSILLDNFAVLAPYSYGQPSFYQDARSKLLQFIDWATKSPDLVFDPNRIFLFGFSDGATVALELMTTRRFAGAVICSYGYTGGSLPARAVERLAGLPLWVFHSVDDVIFDVSNSDRLVKQLRDADLSNDGTLIRYNRYSQDPEDLPARVRGHSMGITASKLPAVYAWMLQQPPLL